MTLMTLILASVVMVAVGLKGPGGMVAALVMGGVVCTALSMAGGFITDLKIGYWLGSTPDETGRPKFSRINRFGSYRKVCDDYPEQTIHGFGTQRTAGKLAPQAAQWRLSNR